jgi:hypothetical protein
MGCGEEKKENIWLVTVGVCELAKYQEHCMHVRDWRGEWRVAV